MVGDKAVPRVRIWGLVAELLSSVAFWLLSPANLLPLRLQGCLASRAFVAMAADVDSLQALGAAPPGDGGIASFKPVLLCCHAALLNVLFVKVSQVVAKVVAAMKGIAPPAAAGVIAVIRFLLRGRRMLVLVVAVEIGATLKRFRIAAGM